MSVLCYEQSERISPNASILARLANVLLVVNPEKSLENAEPALSMEPGSELR